MVGGGRGARAKVKSCRLQLRDRGARREARVAQRAGGFNEAS